MAPLVEPIPTPGGCGHPRPLANRLEISKLRSVARHQPDHFDTAMTSFPLPRKLLSGGGGEKHQYRFAFWKVHPTCVALWVQGREAHRQDTYIGILDTDTWVLYVVPCFGIEPREARRIGLIRNTEVVDGGVEIRLREKLAKHEDLPNDTQLVSGSTARESDTARTATWGELKAVYGKHGVCIAPFSEGAARGGKGFDGISHSCLRLWVEEHITPKPALGDSASGTLSWWFRALGFAIQRDDLSYIVRFSSTLNQGAGQNPSHAMFVGQDAHAAKPVASGETRDPRDMPKEWAQAIVLTLSHDLHLGAFRNPDREERNFDDPRDRSTGKSFGRMLARNDTETTKFKRLT